VSIGVRVGVGNVGASLRPVEASVKSDKKKGVYSSEKPFISGLLVQSSSSFVGRVAVAGFLRHYKPHHFLFFFWFFFLESALFPVFIYLFIYYNNWEKCQIAGDLPSALFDAL